MPAIDGKEHLLHVTIRQIIGAERMHETAPLKIGGSEIYSLMVVANVECQRREKQRRIWLCLDDGTGRIDRTSKFRCFLEESVLEEQEFDFFTYVRVILKPRRKNYLEATHVAVVTDPHEIFYHSLKVIEDSLLLTKGLPSDNRSGNVMNAEVMQSSREDSVILYDPHETLSMEETLSMDMGNLALGSMPQGVTMDDDNINSQASSSGEDDEDEDEYEDTNDEFDLGQIDDNDWFSSTVRSYS